jgi:hypothetical protein
MYAESPRLGALGSGRVRGRSSGTRDELTLLLLASIPGLSFSAGDLLLRHDEVRWLFKLSAVEDQLVLSTNVDERVGAR